MPATYTHYLVAKQVYKNLPHDLKTKLRPSLPLYFFGAQGADFCFFYRSLKPKEKNLGSYLHREGGYPAFCVLKVLAERDTALFAYALGYITHYAADVIFHPYVYATAGKSPLRHSRLENILDIYFKRKVKPDEYSTFFRRKLSDQEKDDLFFVYTAIAVRCGFPAPKKDAFLRSIFLFNAYPPMPNTIFDGYSKQVKALAVNREKRVWNYPADPTIERRDNADELFLKSVALSSRLIQNFRAAAEGNAPLSRALFGKNYLTGI